MAHVPEYVIAKLWRSQLRLMRKGEKHAGNGMPEHAKVAFAAASAIEEYRRELQAERDEWLNS